MYASVGDPFSKVRFLIEPIFLCPTLTHDTHRYPNNIQRVSVSIVSDIINLIERVWLSPKKFGMEMQFGLLTSLLNRKVFMEWICPSVAQAYVSFSNKC